MSVQMISTRTSTRSTIGIISIIVTLYCQICIVSSFTATTTTIVPHVTSTGSFTRNSIVDIGRRSTCDSRLWYKNDKTTIKTQPSSQLKIVVDTNDNNSNNDDDNNNNTQNTVVVDATTRAIALAAAFGQKYQQPEENNIVVVHTITPMQRFFFTLLDIWGYIAFGLGVTLSFGLVLNLFGYVYYITPVDDPQNHYFHFKLIIDTLEHIRMSNELSAMP